MAKSTARRHGQEATYMQPGGYVRRHLELDGRYNLIMCAIDPRSEAEVPLL